MSHDSITNPQAGLEEKQVLTCFTRGLRRWTVAATTVGSGLSYVFGAGVKYVK